MIDVREVKLNLRYPESRQEDITDAFMRGYTNAVEIGNRAIVKLESENERLRELAESRKWVARMLGEQTARVVNLQELVLEMFDGMCDHDSCGTCPHWRDGYNGCEYHERMAQLGIEVD